MFIVNLLCCSEKGTSANDRKNYTIKTISIQDKIDSNSISSLQQLHPIEENRPQNKSISVQGIISLCSIDSESLSQVNEFPSTLKFSSSLLQSEKELTLSNPKVPLQQFRQNDNFIKCNPEKSLRSLDFIGVDIRQWSIKNVLNFIDKIGLKKYQNVFYQNKIKGKDLITLSEEEIRNDLKISKQDQKLLTTYIKFLQERSKKVKSQRKIAQAPKTFIKLNTFHSLSTNSSINRNLLRFIENPIIQESEEQLSGVDQGQRKTDNFANSQMYSPRLNQLFSN